MKNNALRLQIGGSSLTTRPTWCTRNVASKQKWMTSRGLSWKPVANFSSSSIQPQKRYVPNAHTHTGITSLVVMAVWYVYEKSMMRKLAHTTCVCAAYCFCEEKMNPERIWFGFLVWLQADLKMLEEDLSSHRRMCVLLRLAEKRILLSAIECAAQRIKKWAILPPTTSIYPFKREKKCKSMNYQLLCDPVNSFLCQFHPL